MAERKRDLGVFMVPVVGLVITAGALLSIDEADPPVLAGARLLMAAVAAVMTVGSFGFALRWNQPQPPRPKLPAKAHPSPTASKAVPASDHETWGTGGIGGDSAVDTRHLGDHAGMSHASASSDAGGSWDYGGSDVGSDSGGGDSGGGDSGGSSS